MKPEVPWLMAEAFMYAVDSYTDYQVFGDPYPGGSMAQEVYWKMAVRCITEAKRRADAEKKDEEESRPGAGSSPDTEDYFD